MKTLLILFFLFFSSSVVAENQVLYCSVEKAAGFDGEDNYSKLYSYNPKRYTIEIDFKNKKLDFKGLSLWKCDIPTGEQMYCTLDGYSFYIDIKSLRFTTTTGYGWVASNNDDVTIAYGVCEKF